MSELVFLLYAFLFAEKIGFEPMTLCASLDINTAVNFHYSENICSKQMLYQLSYFSNLLGYTDSNRNHLSQSQIY